MEIKLGYKMTKEILCFHTCKNEGDQEFILERAPFHSNTEKPQWLGQGYYLWTDSDFYAKKWGQQKPHYGNYVITKFNLKVEKSSLLDLVGNVNDQLYFFDLVKRYKDALTKKLSEINNPRKKKQIQDAISKPLAVSAVINHYRKERLFPFQVVKAQDIVSEDTQKLDYIVPNKDGASLLYPTRQQIVVYPEARNLLGKAEWHLSETNTIVDEF